MPKFSTEYLTPEQEERLFEYLLTRRPHVCGTGDWQYEIHDLIFMYLDTGARYSEISRLERSQVDLKNRTIELRRHKGFIRRLSRSFFKAHSRCL